MILYLLSGLILIVMIAIYLGKQQRNVDSIMRQNKNVVPLLKHKAAQYKTGNFKARQASSAASAQRN